MYGLDRGVTSIKGTEHVFDGAVFDLRGGEGDDVLGGSSLSLHGSLGGRLKRGLNGGIWVSVSGLGFCCCENEPAVARVTRRSTRRTMTTSASHISAKKRRRVVTFVLNGWLNPVARP
jgi:hypothetical protein